MTDQAPPPEGNPELPTTPEAATGSAGLAKNLNDFFAMLERDTSGALSLLVVLVVGILLSYLLWAPFALPTELVNDLVGDKNCTAKEAGTNDMRTCAATVAAWKMIGPLGIGIAVFVLRKQLAKGIARFSTSLPPGARPLVGPLLATLLFLLVWAGSHAATGGELFDRLSFRCNLGTLPEELRDELLGLIGATAATPAADIDDDDLIELTTFLLAHPLFMLR